MLYLKHIYLLCVYYSRFEKYNYKKILLVTKVPPALVKTSLNLVTCKADY